jgi:lipopolysaccharide transport system ATP-binding protein
MSDIAVRVQNLGKRYRIGRMHERHDTLRDTLMANARASLRWLARNGHGAGEGEWIWALKDVSFEIKRGEVVGVIGRNGAGKSTLLKILSRITEPTEGYAEIYGRVGTLLEVGTGFHPELTGRENIYLSGAILGMRKREIERKFDEIVAFAEIEKFIDTPVKRYSSGMYVRLAFAVAAHLEPEILLVDEVLAVGDTFFQKKCLGKIGDVAKEGRTVLFVSHNMTVIQSLCKTGILLKDGEVVAKGPIDQVVDQYVFVGEDKLVRKTTFSKPSNRSVWVESASTLSNNVPSPTLSMGDKLTLEVNFCADKAIQTFMIGFVISNAQGEKILNANNVYQPSEALGGPVRNGTIRCELGVVPLMENRYVVSLWFGTNSYDFQYIENALAFEVVARDIWGTGKSPTRHISQLWWPTEFKYSTLPIRIGETSSREE